MSKYLPHSDPENESEDERFYESLDRILSSSNSSTSNSEDDNDVVLSSNYCRRGPHIHGNQNYDAWFSIDSFARSSVEQRRDRLLQVLGMSSDASVLWSKNDRSVSFNGYDDVGGMNSSISRSIFSVSCVSDSVVRDNGSIYCDDDYIVGSSHEYDGKNCNVGGGSGLGRMNKDTICHDDCDGKNCNVGGGLGLSRMNIGSDCKNCNVGGGSGLGCMNKDTICHDNCDSKNHNEDGGPGLGCMYMDTIYCDNGNGKDKDNNVVGSGGKCDVDAGDNKMCNVGDGLGLGCMNKLPVERECEVQEVVVEVDKVCRIKNLDNGKEFVVKEVVGKGGTWNKVKEVGTGKQLTMEEFEMCVGHSPIVLELMRRQNVNGEGNGSEECNGENESKSKKKKLSWLKSIKKVASSVTGYRERRSSDEKDTSSEKAGRRTSSATDDSQESSFHGPERVRVRQYGKSVKDFTGLYKSQEIQAHNGSIWTAKFSFDGRYLATAGEDCVIHVWQVVEVERKGELLIDRPDESSLNLLLLSNESPEVNSVSLSLDSTLERKKGRVSVSRKSVSVENIVVPETVFGLSDKPVCSFQGHSDDVLDLSWSKSQLLLSSSMDKTVRLWNLTSKTCVKIFSHSDYVTCIQFNPVDDRYFISGSLDTKVRIWSIPDHQVVDWNDLHEMVTAACYTPDGQGALAGSYKGTCRVYNTSENKLQQKCHINLQNKKKKSHLKKITGFQFAPGSSSEVLITSADSRVRVVDRVDLVHKFKGFRNTNSQISASLTSNGKYVVCASEDSHVYVWKHESDSCPNRSKGITITRSYEHFRSQDVSVAIPWPGIGESCPSQDLFSEFPNRPRDRLSIVSTENHSPTLVEVFNDNNSSPSGSECSDSPLRRSLSSAPGGYSDRISATWPEEKLLMAIKNQRPRFSLDFSNRLLRNRAAWGLVIVTAGLRGELRTFQNFGMPVRI